MFADMHVVIGGITNKIVKETDLYLYWRCRERAWPKHTETNRLARQYAYASMHTIHAICSVHGLDSGEMIAIVKSAFRHHMVYSAIYHYLWSYINRQYIEQLMKERA